MTYFHRGRRSTALLAGVAAAAACAATLSPPAQAAPAADEGTGATPAHGCTGGANLQVAVRNWVVTALIVWAVYLAGGVSDGDWAHPWPLWVVGPWGVVLLAQLHRRRTEALSSR